MIGMIAVVEEPRSLLLDLSGERLIALEKEGFDAVARLARGHGAGRDHVVAARQEGDSIDPLLADAIMSRELAGSIQDDDVRVAEGGARANNNLLAVVGD